MGKAPDGLTVPLDSVLRANAVYKIEFQDSVEHDAVAIARPRGKSASPQPLTIDEVAILLAVRSRRSLPRALAGQLRNPGQTLSRLILGGVLEVRRKGRFVSGMAAFDTPPQADAVPAEANETSRVSDLALRYAIAVRALPPAELAQRLYSFNSLPRVAWIAEPDSYFARCTGIDLTAPSPRIGGRSWSYRINPGWLYFRRGESSDLRFKIYLCPRPEEAHRVIPAFAAELGRSSGAVFKIAYPAAALVRPDKIVTYLPSFEALERTLARLASVTPDVPVQAVPFSAPVPGAPLFSWGVDPPRTARAQPVSWRLWIARQIAQQVHEIPAASAGERALDHLRAGLRLRDIDPHSWLPQQQFLARKWSVEL